ncbi:MAG TPA: Ig-like domain-containing protein [Vulgatibacter sp.]
MRTVLFALGFAVLASGCSQPEFYEMEPGSISFETKGSTKLVRAVAKNRRGQVFPRERPSSWKSSDEKVVTVDADGKITAVGPGQTRITATRGNLVGEIMVDVNSVEGLEVEPMELAFVQDADPVRLAVKVLDFRGKPMEGRTVKARCLDEKICNVDKSLQVWPYNPGETTIEVSCEGHKRQVKVVVAAAKGARR